MEKPAEESPERPVEGCEALCNRLSRLAYRLGAGAPMPPFVQLCDELEVLEGTLDAALAQLEVQDIIERRDSGHLFVSPRLQRSVALACSPRFFHGIDIRDFWDAVVDSASALTSANGQELNIYFSTPDGPDEAPWPEEFMGRVRERKVQGVLGVGLDGRAVQWLLDRAVPIVAHASWAPATVSMDTRHFLELGVSALLAQGCRRLAFWRQTYVGRDKSAYDQEQIERWGQVLAAHNLTFHADLMLDGRPRDERGLPQSEAAQGFAMAHEVFGQPRKRWPDGVLIADDVLTQGVLAALPLLDVQLGRDVRIASHANTGSPVLSGHPGPLCLIEYDSCELVQTMLSQLETLMRGEPLAQDHILIAPHLRNVKAIIESNTP